jgi:hypothetical protein
MPKLAARASSPFPYQDKRDPTRLIAEQGRRSVKRAWRTRCACSAPRKRGGEVAVKMLANVKQVAIKPLSSASPRA